MKITILEKEVHIELWDKTLKFDKTAYALWQLSEAFEIKIKQDVEKLRENQRNGKAVKETYEGYTPEGQQKTAYQVLPWLWDNIDEVGNMMQKTGTFVAKQLQPYGISLNPNWKAISAPFVAKVKNIREILGQAQSDAFSNTASRLANDYQRAYNQELARDYGLNFGILSNSFTAHLVYAAQATAKEMKDKERATEFAASVTGNPMEHLLIGCYRAIYPLYIEKAEPALLQVLSEFYSYAVSLLAKELGYDFDKIAKSFDIDKSLKVLNTSPIEKETVFKALSKNPSNGAVIGYAIMNDLMDDEVIEYAYSSTPKFLSTLKNWAISKLQEIYKEGELFNRPIVNDDNRKIILGLMSFYKKKNRSLFDCEDWQDILTGAFTPIVGKHLTDFAELAITVASPLDFDDKAREGKQFHFSNEIKQTFVFLHNELYFSGARTTASFLKLTSPISVSAFDIKLKEINEKLAVRSKELYEQAEIQRKELERTNRSKKKKGAIAALFAGIAFVPVGIFLFTIESVFLGLVELGVGICGIIYGIKSLKECSEDFQRCEKELYDKRKKKRDAFWAKHKIKIILGSIAFAALIIYLILLPTVIIPNSHYNDAVALMNAGKYEQAIEAFEEMDGYRDSEKQIENCKTAIKEKDYQRALSLMNSGKYEEAIQAFNKIYGYKDSNQKVIDCRTAIQNKDYQSAMNLYNAKRYEEAYNAFKNLSYYKDSYEMRKNSAIKVAEVALSNKNYEKAITWYTTAGQIDKINEVKYQYIMAHKNNEDIITYNYLKELKSDKYKDCLALYSQLYDWKIEIIAVNNAPDSTANMSSISKYDPVYIHFRIIGGTPNEKLKPYIYYHDPMNNFGSYTWDYFCDDHETVWFGWSDGIYNLPQYGEEGILSVSIYGESSAGDRMEYANVDIFIGP